MKRFAHVLQLRLTRSELAFLQRMAAVRRCTIEEIVRAELSLSTPGTPLPLSNEQRHLRLITREEEIGSPGVSEQPASSTAS